MESPVAALAWRFVQLVEAMVQRKKDASDPSSDTTGLLSLVGIHAAAVRLLVMQHEFRQAGKSTKVDLGYHYTRPEHLSSIQTHGLMKKAERDSNEITNVHVSGDSYGDGIYTACSPCTYHGRFGEVGLIVARLLGHNTDACRGVQGTGDSWTVVRQHVYEITVLATSNQCAPILHFHDSQVVPSKYAHAGNILLSNYQAELQTIVDEIFNTPHKDIFPTTLVEIKLLSEKADADTKTPSDVGCHHDRDIPLEVKVRCKPEEIDYLAPSTLVTASCGPLLSAFSPSEEPWKCTLCCKPCHCCSKSQRANTLSTTIALNKGSAKTPSAPLAEE